jgi:hypothetical protein
VWGREIGRLQLDTTGGPSWKPLPVLVTVLVGPFGGAAALWMIVARTGALLAVVGVYRLADRLAGRWAGVVAVLGLVLSPDPAPRFVRLVLEGHSAPLTAALAVWAIDRHLAGKHGAALVLGTLLALDRPEAWPFLALYVVWVWRRDARLRPLAAGMSALLVVLWFGADWWGSGSPLHGADSARVLSDDGQRFGDSVWRVVEVVIAPVWAGAVIATADAWRRRDRVVVALFAGAVAWCALVVLMGAAFGYAALSRFLLPGAAVLCVLGGVGVVRLVAWVPEGRARVVTVVLVVLAFVPAVAVRAYGVPGQVDETAARARVIDDLDAAFAAAGGADAITRCARVAVRDAGVPRVAAAWTLDMPLGRVETRPGRARTMLVEPSRAPSGDERRPGERAAAWARRTGRPAEVVASTRHWTVLAVGCPARH